MDSTTRRARPLVAVGYGPRCVPVVQLAGAAAPRTGEMADLLNRFGPIVVACTDERY